MLEQFSIIYYGDVMEKIKKLIKPSCLIIGSMLLYILILSGLHYIGVIKLSSIVKINFVVIASIMFAGGLLLGKKATKKGYLEGLKLGSIFLVIIFLLNVIFYRHFDLYVVLYYLIILVGSTIGSMIGINLRH